MVAKMPGRKALPGIATLFDATIITCKNGFVIPQIEQTYVTHHYLIRTNLVINEFPQDGFFGRGADVIHLLHPEHLVCGLEAFGHALSLRHLLCQPLQHGIRLPVGVLQMVFQLAGISHPGIKPPAVVFEIALPKPAIFPNLHRLRRQEIRQIIVSAFCIRQFHVLYPFRYCWLHYAERDGQWQRCKLLNACRGRGRERAILSCIMRARHSNK